MEDKISVIIPVYNAAKFLPKCIDSVLNQTYKNLEIILVDDGSTDESGKISDEYSYKDNRVRVIHKENGGSGDARNKGIKAATGKYIGFIDSDDYIETDMYEILLKTLYAYDADIVECAFYRIKKDNITLPPKYSSGTPEQFNVSQAMEELIRNRKFTNMVWNKLYKKDLLQGVEFPVNRNNEDQVFTYKVFAHAQKLVSIDIPKYYYLHRDDSITGSHTYVKTMDFFENYLERLDFISKNFPSLFNLAQKDLLFYLLKKYRELKKNPHLDKDKKKRSLLKNYINANYRSLTSNPLIARKHKILLKIFKINFELGYYLFYFIKRLKKKKQISRNYK